jgi:hypothetical protein
MSRPSGGDYGERFGERLAGTDDFLGEIDTVLEKNTAGTGTGSGYQRSGDLLSEIDDLLEEHGAAHQTFADLAEDGEATGEIFTGRASVDSQQDVLFRSAADAQNDPNSPGGAI